jgi:hypothetical protein
LRRWGVRGDACQHRLVGDDNAQTLELNELGANAYAALNTM